MRVAPRVGARQMDVGNLPGMTPERSRTAWVVGKYLLFQIPGWLVVGCLVTAAVHWWEISTLTACLLFAAWLVKDAVMFPFVRSAYEPSDEGPDRLVGTRAVARDRLDPAGWVRLGPELWRAELVHGHEPVAKGTAVRVLAVNGMVVTVEADSEDPT